MGGLEGEVRTKEPAPASLQRIATRRNEPHGRFAQDVLLDADDSHRAIGSERIRISRPNGQRTETRVAGTPIQLATEGDRNLLPRKESDAAAEERDDVLLEAETEVEDVSAFEEERPLLW